MLTSFQLPLGTAHVEIGAIRVLSQSANIDAIKRPSVLVEKADSVHLYKSA